MSDEFMDRSDSADAKSMLAELARRFSACRASMFCCTSAPVFLHDPTVQPETTLQLPAGHVHNSLKARTGARA